MEEVQKRTRKASTTKESTEVSKKTTPKKATKTTKASTTKKEEAKTPKASVSEKEVKESKTSRANKETKQSKVDSEKKENKAVKSKTIKKEIKTSKTTPIKKEDLESKKEAKTKKGKLKKEEKVSTEKATKKTKKAETSPVGKKYVYISIGSIVVIIIIFVLVMLNVKLAAHAYNVTKEKFTTQNEIEEIDSNFDDEQEVGTVLNNKNETVTKIVEKITLPSNATASIYKAENFTTDTILNDLKLRLGWAKVQDEKKLRAKDENNQTIVAVEKQTMKESIQNIFGTNIEYRDESFENTDVSSFVISSENKGIVKYDNDLYTATVTELEQNDMPLIYQEIQKVVQYDNRIMVYVKTAFIDVKDGKYIIYKNHNGEFNNKVLETTREELFTETSFNQYTGEGTVSIKEDSKGEITNIRKELNTYIYTFVVDNQTNEYYLSGFNGGTNRN